MIFRMSWSIVILWCLRTILLCSCAAIILRNCIVKQIWISLNYLIGLYLVSNKLTINTNKSKHVLYHLPRSPDKSSANYTLLMNAKYIDRVSEFNYLGVNFDENLTWKPHILKLKRKIRGNFALIRKIANNLDAQTLNLLYHALILSHIRYGISVWHHGNKVLLNNIQRICTKAEQLIARKYNFSGSLYPLPSNDYLTVSDQYKLSIALIVYRYINKSIPPVFDSFFKPVNQIHNFNTRNCNKLFTTRFTKNISQQNIAHTGPKIWQLLPLSFTNEATSVSETEFCNKLKNLLLQK